MSRTLTCLAVLGSLIAGAASARGQTLIAASDASQIQELKVAKVMAPDSPFWLGVRLRGKSRLAFVTADAAVESAPAADAWLRALDYTTRVRVAPPLAPLASCGSSQDFGLVDSGLPDPPVVKLDRVLLAGSELELRRALEEAGLTVNAERVAHFASSVAAPFRVSLFEVPAGGGATTALRLLDPGEPGTAPQVETVGRDAVPISFIGLATAAVLPPDATSADPSEFAVTYRAASLTNPSTDYLAARANWLSDHPQHWLVETQNQPSLFSWTLLAPKAPLAPAVTGYFQGQPSSCADQVQSARARGSQQAVDYVCADHDDLARSLTELGFGDLRLSRSYGSLGSDASAFRVVDGAQRSPLVNATDIDRSACPSAGSAPPATDGSRPSPNPDPPVVVNDPGPGGSYGPDPGTPVYTGDGACNVTIVDSESCSGDSSASDGRSDSCSGDSSPSDGSSDSCSGDSSSGDSSGDSCSGSSDSSADSGGCGKSDDGYNGDTCTGSSHSSAEATGSASAALHSEGALGKHRSRRVHLSLLTLFAAALALPFRRLRALRF